MSNQAIQERYLFNFDNDGYFESSRIPKEVATCPNCDSELCANAEEWETESKMPTTIKVDCIRGIDCFIEYEHSVANRMPYVYWLPLETSATAWVLKQLKI